MSIANISNTRYGENVQSKGLVSLMDVLPTFA